MKQSTYDYIANNIKHLDIDYRNGLVKNRTHHLGKNGYFNVSIKNRKINVHNLIAFLKYGEGSIDLTVNHLNGIKTDNRPENLEMATYSENAKHAFKLGLAKPTRVYGVKHGKSKLIDDEVREIKQLLRSGVFQRVIAEKYNISQSTVAQIKRGETWENVK